MNRLPKDKKKIDITEANDHVNNIWGCKPGRYQYPDGSEIIIHKDGCLTLIEAQDEYKTNADPSDEQ
jgi:hypothetical protein